MLITPIFDRTFADVALAKVQQSNASTELKGALDYRTLNRIETNIEYLANRLNTYGYFVSVSVKKDWVNTDNLYTTDFERILTNVKELVNSYVTTNNIDVNTFLVFTNKLNHIIINNIEYLIFDIDFLLTAMINALPKLSFTLGGKQLA